MPLKLPVFVRRLGLLRSPVSRIMSTATPETDSNSNVANKHLKFTAGSTRLPIVAEARVNRVWQESPTVRCLTLTLNNPAFHFKAGQWVDMFIPGVETVGGFSMFSAPSQLTQDGTIDLGIKFSRWPPAYWVHDQCRVGSEVMLRVGGDFYYAPETGDTPHDLLLVGGGVGVNPLASIFLHAASLHANHQQSQDEYRPGRILLLYSSRTYEELLYKDQLNNVAAKTPEMDVHYFTTRKPAPDPTLATYNHISPEMIQSAVNSLDKSHLKTFICGPPPMIESINELLLQNGLSQEQILYEKWW